MNLISPSEADTLVADLARPAPTIRLPLQEAGGCVLREDLRADRPFPPFDRVTMDGIAIRTAAWARGHRSFRRTAVQSAGEPARTLEADDACIEVMTGALRPEGADAIVPAEQLTWAGDIATVSGEVVAGQFIHPRGSDAPAGAVLVPAGSVLTPGAMAAAAAVGADRVCVAQPPRIALLDTGNELVEIARTPAAHELRRSNSAMLAALLRTAGALRLDLRHARDDEAEILAALDDALAGCDLVILTGGISAGRFDLVASVLGGLGARFAFHGVRQNPGKPLAVAVSRDHQPVFALPGNPVSAAVCCARFVLPFLARRLGARPRPALRARLEPVAPPKPGWSRYELCRFGQDPDGGLRAQRLPLNTSGDLRSLAAADGFVEVTEEALPARPCWSLQGPRLPD